MLNRREFLARSTSACVTAGVLIACGGGAAPGPDPDPDPDPGTDAGTEGTPENPGTPDGGTGNPETPDGGTQQNASCLDNGTLVEIRSNHGHQLTVPIGDIQAGQQKAYNIQGTSSHPHTVTVTAAHFEALARNESVTITSTTDGGHSHVVVVSCA